MAAAAITATIGASAGYYATAYISAVRWSYREQSDRGVAMRIAVANLFAVRSMAIEFGPAELIDTHRGAAGGLLRRTDACSTTWSPGWIFAKLFSDIGFYVIAVFSYERFNGLLAVPPADQRGGRR